MKIRMAEGCSLWLQPEKVSGPAPILVPVISGPEDWSQIPVISGLDNWSRSRFNFVPGTGLGPDHGPVAWLLKNSY